MIVLIDIMNFNGQKTFIFKSKNGDKSNVIRSYYSKGQMEMSPKGILFN